MATVERFADLRDATHLVRIVPNKRPVFKELNPAEIVVNKKRNRRDEWGTYEFSNLAMTKLRESINIQGMLAGLEPVVNVDENGVKEVLIGHRRITACQQLGLTSVLCVVYTGLTEEQKLMIIYNPAEEPEGKIGEMKQVRELRALGLSRKAVAQKLGWKTTKGVDAQSKVQGYDELLSLPEEVINEWIEQQRNPKGEHSMPDLGLSTHIRQLYKAMNDENDAFPLGNGPDLTKEIEKLKVEKTTTAGKEKKDALNAKAIKGLASMAKNFVLKEFLSSIAGVENCNHGPLLDVIDKSLAITNPNPKPVLPATDAPTTVDEVFGETKKEETKEEETKEEVSNGSIEVVREGTVSETGRKMSPPERSKGKMKPKPVR